jgi:hypothetical protein
LNVLPFTEKAYKIVPTHAEMTVDEWIAIADNPRQRDTERHLRRAKHLQNPSPAHSLVSMARDASGRSWKLDGHTRALAWKRGLIQRPGKIIATIFPVHDAAEAAELYRHFDNQGAVETTSDQVSGAWRELGWIPESKLLQRGALTDALRNAQGLARNTRTAAHDMTIYELVRAWKKEILTLDLINPQREQFIGGCVAAALMCFRRDGDEATEFWRLYATDGGQKFENLIDPVENLTRYIRELRAARKTAGAGMDIIGKALAAYTAHQEGRTYTGGLRATDPSKFLPPQKFK